MPLFQRVKYAAYFSVAITMTLGLTLSISEGLGIYRGLGVADLMFHPLYLLPVLAIGFVLAPAMAERLPITDDTQTEQSSAKPAFGYTTRVVALAFLAFVLAMIANLVVYLLGKFT